MPELAPLQGDLQLQVMAAMWRLGTGTVEDVRGALPPRYRGAYTTVQTVLNRLAERGLLARRKEGNVIVYRPRISEAEYLSRSIERALAAASQDARQAALAELIGGLDAGELADLRRRARESRRGRRRR
jgi:predicted transcriptional regulator